MSLLNTLIPSLSRSVTTPAADSASTGPAIRPTYDVKETDDAYGLTAFLPGVAKENLEITVADGEFRLVGRRAWKQPDGWTALYRESTDAPFELVLTHDNLVDADKVVAELKNGVLQVSLPKREALKPRKIAVN